LTQTQLWSFFIGNTDDGRSDRFDLVDAYKDHSTNLIRHASDE